MCKTCACSEEAVRAAGQSGDRRVLSFGQDLLAKNDRLAGRDREDLRALGVPAFSLVSSPGAGKTTLLARSIRELRERFPVAVIEGDQQTCLDAERVAAAGARAVQVNTGKGCHLDADMVYGALRQLELTA